VGEAVQGHRLGWRLLRVEHPRQVGSVGLLASVFRITRPNAFQPSEPSKVATSGSAGFSCRRDGSSRALPLSMMTSVRS